LHTELVAFKVEQYVLAFKVELVASAFRVHLPRPPKTHRLLWDPTAFSPISAAHSAGMNVILAGVFVCPCCRWSTFLGLVRHFDCTNIVSSTSLKASSDVPTLLM
jgi:hypothetical protein